MLWWQQLRFNYLKNEVPGARRNDMLHVHFDTLFLIDIEEEFIMMVEKLKKEKPFQVTLARATIIPVFWNKVACSVQRRSTEIVY